MPKKVADRIFEIVSNQLKVQKQRYDPTREVKSLKEILLHERAVAENEIGKDKNAALLSDDYILNRVENTFISGCEAIHTALRWLIAFLVNYPECQTDIQHELDEEIGRAKMPKLNHNLPILRATVMEAHFASKNRRW